MWEIITQLLSGREAVLVRNPGVPLDHWQSGHFDAERVKPPNASGGPVTQTSPFTDTREQFLYIRHRLQIEGSESTDAGERSYTIPFLLVVPAGIDRTNEWVEDTCRPLPPSFRAQDLVLSPWTAPPPPRASISYDVRASLEHTIVHNGITGRSATIAVSHPVILLPYVEIPPPIETRLFASEYVLSVTEPVWKSIIGRKVGRITVTTAEPRPLVYDSTELPVTECSFDISIEGDVADHHHLRSATIELDPVLQSRAYFSAKRLKSIPNQEEAYDREQMQCYTSSVRLEKHILSSLQWNISSNQLPLPASEYSGRTLLNEAERINIGRRESTEIATVKPTPQGERKSITWHTVVTIPIKPPSTLQPSFCDEYVASTYAIIAKVSTRRVYTKSMYLVSPLQVAYPLPASQEANQRQWDTRGTSPTARNDDNDDACCTSMDVDADTANVSERRLFLGMSIAS